MQKAQRADDLENNEKVAGRKTKGHEVADKYLEDESLMRRKFQMRASFKQG